MISNKVSLSKAFKKQAGRSIAAIIFFVLVYLVLFILAIGLTAACIYGGVMLSITFPRLITIALGIGLASMGLIILFFLLKFVFSSNKIDRSHLVEITREQEPELFEMLDVLVKEVGTKFPKKVYLTAEVNAFVFYDSSFWSMFFPVKKNLAIGIALVNGISLLELKAILAHEFGHFSQRSMKVGSYVYNVNQVIYNMLYQNDGIGSVIEGWGSISGYFGIFMAIAVWIINGIQWILRKVYNVVNLAYMGLSREMEFHADEIAANVTGPSALKDSLLRMNLLEYAYNGVLNHYSERIKENKKSANLFKEQAYLVDQLARESELPYKDNLPEVSLEELNKFNKSKLVIKNQWASHPSVEDRINRLDSLGLKDADHNGEQASELFKDFELVQEQFTTKMFEPVNFEGEVTVKSLEQFKADYLSEVKDTRYADIYNGYYDDRNPVEFDPDEVEFSSNGLDISELFNQEKIDLVYTSRSLDIDLEVLEQIARKQVRIKSFDYDGKKFRQKEANKLVAKLKDEQKRLHTLIEENDKAIFSFFRQKEKSLSQESKLAELYRSFFALEKENEPRLEIYTQLMERTQFFNVPNSIDAIRNEINHLSGTERRFKKELNIIMEDNRYKDTLSEEMRSSFETYLKGNWTYFRSERYVDDNLEKLFTAINQFAEFISSNYRVLKKDLLGYQGSLLQ